LTTEIPVPLPMYKNAARKIGAMSPNNNLAMGALAPKNIAASKAWKMNGRVADFTVLLFSHKKFVVLCTFGLTPSLKMTMIKA